MSDRTIAAAYAARAALMSIAVKAEDDARADRLGSQIHQLDALVLEAPPHTLSDVVAKLRVIVCPEVGICSAHRGDGLDLVALRQVVRFLEALCGPRSGEGGGEAQ